MLTDKLAEIIATLQGPGFEAARAAARMEAYSSLTAAAMWFVVACAFAGSAVWLYLKAEDKYDDLIPIAGLIGLVAAGIFGGVLWVLVDPWTWTTINNPELWIAKKVLKL